MAGSGNRSRDDLLSFTNATISLRWLALAALIVLEALTPTPTPRGILVALYGAALAYTLAVTLFVWRFPERAAAAARLAVPLDTGVIGAGLVLLSGHQQELLLLAFPVAAIAGLLLGYGGAVLVALAIAVAQLPIVPASLFSPNRFILWAFAALTVLGAGTAAAAGSERLSERRRFREMLDDLRYIAQGARSVREVAASALQRIAAQFRAQSGSVMLFDSTTDRLEILAALELAEGHREARPRLGEGIAGWVAQERRAVLLTPGAAVPFRLVRHEIGSSLCVPLATAAGPLGVLNLNRGTSAAWFTQEDLTDAEIAAQPLAGVLQQAQDERRMAAAITELADGFEEVSRTMSRDPAVLWPVLLDTARSLTQAHFAVLALEREDTGTVDIVASRGIDGRTAREYAPSLLAASTQGHIRTMDGGFARGGRPSVVTCVPLRVDTLSLGAIGLGLDPAHAAPPLLHAVAAHVAAAVHTARSAHRIADVGVAEERRRIAREMHDGLAQTIADALLQTDLSTMAAQANPTQVGSDLKELRALLERAMRELREFMTELRRQDETEGSLFAALEAMAREFTRRMQIAATVSTAGDDAHIPSAVRHAVLAIVRQALTNVRAHARATAVTIRAEVTEETVSAAVTDNGIGFDLAAYRARPAAPHHLGITSMEERADLVDGRLRIETASGRGTLVAVDIPVGRSDA